MTAALLALILSLPDAPRAQARAGGRPEIKLVLLIAVDQFRYDYLTRFRPEYTGGLSQLLTRGATFTQAYLDHYPTVTAVGHSTMLSGAIPAVSGIVGNDWYDRGLGASVTSVSDPDAKLVGAEGPGSSPRRLLVSTLGDEMKNAAVHLPAESAPKVFGLSLKDRSAIMPVGHRADAAYWLDVKKGVFVTSTHYRAELHAWAAQFNQAAPADKYAGRKWEFLDPGSGSPRMMPPTPGPQLYAAVYGSPFGNELLKDFAVAAIEAEKLGQRGVTDLLTVSFSSNDAIGHTYGPDSPEVRDMAVRVDRTIGELLARVDALVGLDHTIVAFTADHGVAPVPELQQQRKLPGGRLKQEELFGPITAAPDDEIRRGQVDSGHRRHVALPESPAHRGKGARPGRGPTRRRRRGQRDPARRPRLHARAAAQRRGLARPDRPPHRPRATTCSDPATSRSCSTPTGCARRPAPRTARPTPTTPTSRSC